MIRSFPLFRWASAVLLCLLFVQVMPGPPPAIRTASPRTGKDLALFFAVNRYDSPLLWPNLQYAISDAEKIAGKLYDLYGFDTLIVRNPALFDILETLHTFRQKTYAPDAQLLIFFSGHGDFNDEIKMGYFVPRDVRPSDRFRRGYLEFPTLKREVTSISCNHILLAIDACYSGAFDDEIAMRSGNGPGHRPISPEEDLQNFIDKQLAAKTRRVLTSGAKEQTPERSQFAEQFLNALENGASPDKPVLTLTELCSFLEKARPAPHFASFQGDEIQSSFVFVSKMLPADNWTGILPEFIDPDAAKLMFGLNVPVYRVSATQAGSPAEKAGLREGDIITGLLDPAQILSDQASIRLWSRQAFANGSGRIRILRKETGRFMPLEITLAK